MIFLSVIVADQLCIAGVYPNEIIEATRAAEGQAQQLSQGNGVMMESGLKRDAAKGNRMTQGIAYELAIGRLRAYRKMSWGASR